MYFVKNFNNCSKSKGARIKVINQKLDTNTEILYYFKLTKGLCDLSSLVSF